MAQMCWAIVEVSLCVQRLTEPKGFAKRDGRNGQPVSNSYLFFNAVLLIASKLHLNLPANNQWHLFYIWFHRYEATGCEGLNLHIENEQILPSNKWDLLKSKQSLLCSQLRGYVTDKRKAHCGYLWCFDICIYCKIVSIIWLNNVCNHHVYLLLLFVCGEERTEIHIYNTELVRLDTAPGNPRLYSSCVTH